MNNRTATIPHRFPLAQPREYSTISASFFTLYILQHRQDQEYRIN
jgi:hypothetical protein